MKMIHLSAKTEDGVTIPMGVTAATAHLDSEENTARKVGDVPRNQALG